MSVFRSPTRRTAMTMLAATPLLAAPAAGQATASTPITGPSIVPSDFGLNGRYAQDATAGMQRMFDQAPAGAIIDFAHGMDDGGDYRITNTVVIRQQLNLRGRNSRIVGDMPNYQTDLVHFQPETELRGVLVEGLRLGFNAGGRDTIVFDGGEIGVIGNVVSRCSITGGPGGYAVRLAGIGNHFNVIRDCTLMGTGTSTGAVMIASADGNKLLDNVIGGVGSGVRLELVNGAYKTGIIGGAIVSRDGGVFIAAGQQVDIERVQFEQGLGHADGDGNRADYKSHIILLGSGEYPNGEEVRDVRIIACNFGSGSNQSSAITLAGYARDTLIDENYFASIGTDGIDIAIEGPDVLYTRIGPNNRVGGIRDGISRGKPNQADPKELFAVRDKGTGTYGALQPAEALGMRRGWIALDKFGFWKTEDDILRFRSALKSSNPQVGAVIGNLPAGFRPATTQRTIVPTATDEQAVLTFEPDGNFSIQRVTAGAIVYFDQVALPIAGGASYSSGPY